jgi:hypothetical protein
MLSLALLFLLTACGSDDDTGADPTSTPSDEPIPVHSVESLREQADELQGTVVTVRSNYWNDGDRQYLSDIMMESYPPQIPFDQAVILLGDMPESVLELLNHAGEGLAPVVWGEVDITGEVSVEGDEVHLEIHEAFAVQG